MVIDFLKSGYQKIKAALAKTRSLLSQKLRSLFQSPLDPVALEKLEQLFYEADLGVETAGLLTDKVRKLHQKDPKLGSDGLMQAIRQEILSQLVQGPAATPIATPAPGAPLVILVVGVNGNGKTTTIAKLAKHYQAAGKKVILAAADTFRAAATEQLQTWAERLAVDCIKALPKSDPASVAFDAISAGIARQADVVIIDTAGRLHNKTHLMQELTKIRRSCHKASLGAPHETLLVLDATIGQNAIDQAKAFHHYTPLTGLVLTKLDGTAKGGIVVNIQKQLALPVQYIGTGEGLQDLELFNPETFVSALFDE
jgi:fused signal recognition particle receptor